MSEHPEARDIINKFLLTDGRLSATEIDRMPYRDYQAWIICKNAMTAGEEIRAFKSRSTVVNKQYFMNKARGHH